MATAAFKSTTKRTPHGNSPSDSSTHHRRSRSLSRFSHRTPSRGKFVNTVRGSGFPEISLDDLACEFFGSDEDRRGRADTRGGDGKLRRGRSVSRNCGSGSGRVGSSVGGERVGSECNSRRRRSVSVARRRDGDCERGNPDSRSRANLKSNGGGNTGAPSFYNKPIDQSGRQGLRKTFSQKDLKIYDDHSSQSSVLTDEEGKDASINSRNERKASAFNAGKKAGCRNGNVNDGQLYEAMKKELRHAVEEMKDEIEHAMLKRRASSIASSDGLQLNSSDMLLTVSNVRKNSMSKVQQQSANYKQDLLEMMLEEEHGRDHSDVVRNLLPDSAKTVEDISPAFRKRSNDKSKMSKKLTEEAEKYFEDFISNVEDTDISSLDGEISDTSSVLGGVLKLESFQSPTTSNSLPAELDGINLPWLQWETSNDASLSYKCKPQLPITPIALTCNASREPTTMQDTSNCSSSSRGSWSPAMVDVTLPINGEDISSLSSRRRDVSSCRIPQSSRRLQVDVGQYLKLESREDLLFERWNQQRRISSGSLLICDHMLF